ncbi:MAG: hypothetical protein A2054_05325 [Deltaproteobacteria bacterium GWA2_55_10]|nr:MAG: hypothetical protein A2054_05325 [Deltaproteobacteria bacterium GWA2_55_10]
MAQKLDEILSNLSEAGFRLTRLRRAVIEIFLGSTLPLSAVDIIARLEKKKAAFNKTTVYRELAFLKETGIVKEIQFLHERVKRYELSSLDHHHHLICLKCKKVEDVVLESHLEEQEEKILRSTGFHVLNHSLEFLGICHSCR